MGKYDVIKIPSANMSIKFLNPPFCCLFYTCLLGNYFCMTLLQQFLISFSLFFLYEHISVTIRSFSAFYVYLCFEILYKIYLFFLFRLLFSSG